MRWFGPKWGAPICDELEEATAPVGDPCFLCGEPIAVGQRGLLIPHMEETADVERPWHVRCFLRSIVGDEKATDVRMQGMEQTFGLAPPLTHVMAAGSTLCRCEWAAFDFGIAEAPRRWPEFHKWVPLEDRDKADCLACKAWSPHLVNVHRDPGWCPACQIETILNHTHCPKCNAPPQDHQVRNFDPMWRDGDVFCLKCGTRVRGYDAG